MHPIIQEITTAHSPESLVELLADAPGTVLLHSVPHPAGVAISAPFDSPQTPYSVVTARPFLTFRSFGSRCELTHHASPVTTQEHFGNPWHLLDSLMSRYELLDEVDLPFPLGGCFGYWGYDLKNFVEPKLPRRAVNDLEWPDCHVGFYDSVVVFDHGLGKTWIISTGLDADGSRSEDRMIERLNFWRMALDSEPERVLTPTQSLSVRKGETQFPLPCHHGDDPGGGTFVSNLSREQFISAVERAQRYIRAGDIYQVNLSHRVSTACALSGWELFQRLSIASPAPFSAFLDCDDGSGHGQFQIASSSPEQFLRLSGSQIQTRPIKGTRPRDPDPTRDAQLAYELQTSSKELAELVMITDLLRNDVGKVSEFGSVQVPELVRLERFAQVQHLVSTVEGRLRKDVTHFAALASCFPGGSITGAPKIRAMEIIDELEPLARGPYTGALGYLGFNRESQLSIIIRTAICRDGVAHFNVGAGIVADSIPAAEYEETLAKAAGFLRALELGSTQCQIPASTETPGSD